MEKINVDAKKMFIDWSSSLFVGCLPYQVCIGEWHGVFVHMIKSDCPENAGLFAIRRKHRIV